MYHLGKIPNMASQGFKGELFHKEVLPGRKYHKKWKNTAFSNFFLVAEGVKTGVWVLQIDFI
jgi:hypothetical protein